MGLLKSPSENVNHERLSTIFLVTVLMLQVFRRLSTEGYVAVLLIAYIYWFKSIHFSSKIKGKKAGFYFVIAFIFLPFLSLITGDIEDFTTAIIRYGAMCPFLVIGMLYPHIIYNYLDDIIKINVLVIVVSAVLMIYQIPFGRISFFVETTERLGYERYGSLLGSTTAYGTGSLVALMCLYDFDLVSGWKRLICEFLILIGGILCLSKAFFVNAAIAYSLIFFFHKSGSAKISLSIRKMIIGSMSLVVLVLSLYYVIHNTFIGDYFWGMLNYSFDSNSLGVESDLLDRLTVLPLRAFTYYNLPYAYYLLFGVGFKGFSGILGLPQYPMCHNTYFEIILSQGLPVLLCLLSIYVSAFLSQLKSRDGIACFVKQLVPYILINMLAGQTTYMSVGGILNICIIYSVSLYHTRRIS